MTRLQEFVERCDACYLRRKGFAVRFVLRVSGGILDLEVQSNPMGLQCLMSDIGRLAAGGGITWAEAAILTEWIRRSFLAM